MGQFCEYPFIEAVQHALMNAGYTEPTAIQSAVIPPALEGNDIIAAAPTGTGKTAAFLLPIIHRILTVRGRTGHGRIRALIVAPTRELVLQTRDFALLLLDGLDVSVTTVIGGTGISPQLQELRRGTDIVIATPGRAVELIERGELIIECVEQLVLDEVDRMLELGFIRDIKRIVDPLDSECQRLFFSATVTSVTAKVAGQALQNSIVIDLSGTLQELSVPSHIEANVLFVDEGRKRKLLQWLLKDISYTKVLIFVRNKSAADRLRRDLENLSFPCLALHGSKGNAERQYVMERFSRGRINILIATDIAARGLDFPDLSHVINFDLPHSPETFLHRIGRSGRVGRKGVSFSFCDRIDRLSLFRIARAFAQPLTVFPWQPFHSEKIELTSPEEARERHEASRHKADDGDDKTEKSDTKTKKPRTSRDKKDTPEAKEAMEQKVLAQKIQNRKRHKQALEAKYGKKETGKGRQKKSRGSKRMRVLPK